LPLRAAVLADIPGVLINGRFDYQAPIANAWRLREAWPSAELVIVDDTGHGAGASIGSEIVRATQRFDPGHWSLGSAAGSRLSVAPDAWGDISCAPVRVVEAKEATWKARHLRNVSPRASSSCARRRTATGPTSERYRGSAACPHALHEHRRSSM
jgi:hypothetical protein